MKVWDAATGQETLTLTLKGHTGDVRSVAFSPDGKRLASGGGSLLVMSIYGKTEASASEEVKVWGAATGQETLTLTGHTSWVQSVAFSPDSRRLASGGGDGTVARLPKEASAAFVSAEGSAWIGRGSAATPTARGRRTSATAPQRVQRHILPAHSSLTASF